MESPVKTLNLVENKENIESTDVVTSVAIEPVKPKIPELEVSKHVTEKKPVAEGIKSYEADEPLLRENPGRFVLFPIKYHEVCLFEKFCCNATRRVY